VPQILLDFGRHPILRPALVVDLINLVLYSHCNVEIDNLQAEVFIQEKVVRLDIPVGYMVLVKIREALDEAPADLGNLASKSVRSELEVTLDGEHFGQNGPPVE